MNYLPLEAQYINDIRFKTMIHDWLLLRLFYIFVHYVFCIYLKQFCYFNYLLYLRSCIPCV